MTEDKKPCRCSDKCNNYGECCGKDADLFKLCKDGLASLEESLAQHNITPEDLLRGARGPRGVTDTGR